ncbi:MAG: glutamine synthetase family protein [Candidatus Heimdallarchaeaceae archaeon]
MSNFDELFKQKDIDFIQFQFTTIFGDLKSVEFPAKIWPEMKDGSGVDGSSLGFLRTEQSDMKIIPDYETFLILPWETRVGRFICDIYHNDGTPHSTDPRNILKKTIKLAKDMGYQYQTRPELEWFFIDEELDPADDGRYMDTLPLDSLGVIRRNIAKDLMEVGIPIKTIHHECGAGQQEIEFIASEALKQADNVQTAKLIIKANSLFEDLIASFMPKPFPNEAGNGFHIHQYLTKDGENIFSDEEKGISDILRYFVGGVLEHVDAMTAFLNPTTNSYKRLVPGHEAPVYKSWGVGNRTALIRVPGYEKKARIEYRGTDATTNIYLASSLLLAAGLDGVKKKIEPIQPTTKNIEKLSTQERKELGITRLPTSLGEALDNMEQSDFIKEVLGKEIIEIFLDRKRQEIKNYEKARSKNNNEGLDWEYEQYLIIS